jgi:hypothetical protein
MSSICHIDARVVVHVDRGDTMSLKWGHQWTYCSSPRLYIRMEPRRNIIDRRKPKKVEKILSQCHFVHHKSHMD